MIDKLSSSYPYSLENIFKEAQETFKNLPWEDPHFYGEWLAQTFFMVSHTPRFICLAAARFDVQEDFLHRKMVAHFADEDEHEYILLDDLKNIGFDIKDYQELPQTSLVVQQLYYQIDRIDPIAIFGRILFLELMASTIDSSFFQDFQKHYTENQSHFLRIHMEEDVTHVQKAFSVLDHIPKEKHHIIGDNFYLTGYLYKQFLDGIVRKYRLRSVLKAAA